MSSNEFVIREYLAALERSDDPALIARFFTHDATQEEYPNRLNPNGGVSDLATLQERMAKGAHVLQSQRYEVRSLICAGDTVAVEAIWTATLAIPIGVVPTGGTMRARFAMFFDLVDGRIRRQRNYDCFDPF